MEVKTFMMAMGLGAAAGTAVGMMMPRNKTMRQIGKNVSTAAADTVTRAVNTVEKKMQ